MSKENSKPISNLQARHGTRSPTKKRMRELDKLATHLQLLLRDAKEQNLSLKKVPAWLWGWQSPWKGKVTGGELTDVGEVELYHLAIRIRERFPDLFDEEYHPDIYTIKATQVSPVWYCVWFSLSVEMCLHFDPLFKPNCEMMAN